MLSRLLSRFKSGLKTGEREPLLSNRQESQSAFSCVPKELISEIASFLNDKDKASLAKTSKQLYYGVAIAKTNVDVIAKKNNGEEVTRKATYTELCKILNARLPIEQRIRKIEPGPATKCISSNFCANAAICLSLTSGVGIMVGGSTIAATSTSAIGVIGGICLGVVGSVTIVAFSTRSYFLFRNNVAKRENEVNTLRLEFNTPARIV